MTNTQIYWEAKRYIADLNKNIFACDRQRTEKCRHELRFRHELLRAFYAGYDLGKRDKK